MNVKWIFRRKEVKQFWIIFKRINENYDGSRRERYSGTPRTARTAANIYICNVNVIFSQKRAIIHQTTHLKRLGLYTVACIPEPVKDVDKLQQHVIEVLACMQQTVVDEATGERKISLWVCSRVKWYQFEELL